MIELDHLILFCAPGAPETALLRAHGLVDTSGQSHPGQGTANRRVSFANAFLELLWVEDAAVAQRPAVAPTQLWARWAARTTGGCPFGLVFRPAGNPAESARPPFETWAYRPPYFPAGLAIEVGVGIALHEPLLFYLPFARQRAVAASAEPIPVLRGVQLGVATRAPWSAALAAVVATGVVAVEHAADDHAVLQLQGSGCTSVDLRPALPFVLDCAPIAG